MPPKKKKTSSVPMTDDMNALRHQHFSDLSEFGSTQFYPQEDEFGDVKRDDPVKIEDDPIKGRVLIALRGFQPGDIIFKEKAFVCASWNEFHCIECMKPHKPTQCDAVRQRYTKTFIENLSTIENQLADMEEIGEIDRARCLIKAVSLISSNPESPSVLDFLRLATVRPEEAYDCITQLASRKLIKNSKIFPPGFDLMQAAHVLSILNCNSHEIENIGGSGVFLQASMMEHNCLPNCNFVTQDRDIFVVCIHPIQPGDSLSIDYAQTFYYPAAKRKEALYKSHDFVCQCALCTSLPDRCRAFNCPQSVRNRAAGIVDNSNVITPENCINGVVCPIGEGNQLEDWKCIVCGYQLTQDEVNVCLQAEANYPPPPSEDEYEREDEVEEALEEVRRKDQLKKAGNYDSNNDTHFATFSRDVNAINAILAEGVIHETHFTIFHSLLREGYALAKLASTQTEHEASNNKKKSKAQQDAEDEEFLRQFSEGKFNAERMTGRLKVDKRKKDLAWQRAASVWKRIIACAEAVLPQYHPDKPNFLDSLAQVLVTGKDFDAAQKTWKKAWELSCFVASKDTKQTLQLKRLYKKTPRSVEELMFHYDNVNSVLDQIEYEDDDASRKLIEGLAASTIQALEDEEVKIDDMSTSESDFYQGSDDDDDDDEDEGEDEDDDNDNDDDMMASKKKNVTKKEADLLFGLQSQYFSKPSALSKLTKSKFGQQSTSSNISSSSSPLESKSNTSDKPVGSGWGKKVEPKPSSVIKTSGMLQINLPRTTKQKEAQSSSIGAGGFKKFTK